MPAFFKKINLFLLAIVAVATFLRFFQLGQNPPSLTWDETAWGYSAYSLGIDGRDEFGKFLPLNYLESFGDFKPPIFAYLDILPVKIFGLNEFAVRFPSALLGVMTVLATYFLVKRLFGDQGKTIALISSFILTISPWHVNLSRAAFEANVATFFIVIGVWLFLKGIQNKKWYLVISVISFALSIYTFNTARIVSPLLVLILSIGFRKELLQRKKETIIAAITGFLLIFPVIPFLLSPQANLRFREVNIFTNIDIIKRTNQQIENDKNAIFSKIIHNRRFAYAVEYLSHYFDNFSPNFLFIKGDGNPKFSTQDVGQLYLWEFPFLVLGVLYLFKKRESHWWIIPVWLLTGILPAATARETPHALRIETTLPTFQILVAYGILFVFKKVSTLSNLGYLRYLIFSSFFLFLIFNILYYLHGYYVHYSKGYSREWQYGYKDSIAYVEKIKDKYDQIYVTMDLGRPYIYYLFYTKTEPSYFRKTAKVKRDVFGFVTVEGFDKYKFVKDLNTAKDSSKKTLVIRSVGQIPESAKLLKKFNVLDGTDTLWAYEK